MYVFLMVNPELPVMPVPHAERGFTLIELLITVSIAAIMLTLAIPSFQSFLLNNRLTSQTNDFVLALASARSEAVKRGVRVSVCSRDSDATCAASTTWGNGWLVFVDNNGDGTVDGTATPPDIVLQVRSTLEGSNTLTETTAGAITFQNTGYPAATNVFTLGDASGNSRTIRVCSQGLVVTGGAACP
jgi:type IV fimbrial biogenesis protein FimT